jgi:hypothetical protein
MLADNGEEILASRLIGGTFYRFIGGCFPLDLNVLWAYVHQTPQPAAAASTLHFYVLHSCKLQARQWVYQRH